MEKINNQKTIYSIALIITEQCNLRCKYCYVKNKPEVISYGVVDASIKLIKDILESKENNSVYLDLFGGEPLLESDIIKYIIEKIECEIEDYYMDNNLLRLSIYTNCTTLTEDILKYTVNKNFIRYNFSLDGCSDSHNAGRVYEDGAGSYEDAIRGLNLYCSIYHQDISKMSKQWTVSPNNVMHLSNDFKKVIDNGLKVIGLHPIKEGWGESSLKILDNELEKISNILIEEIDNDVHCKNFHIYAFEHINNLNQTTFCDAGKYRFAVSPNGLIYPCQRMYSSSLDKFIIGNVFDGIDENNSWRIFFKNHTSDIFSKCSNCKIFNGRFCGGQCMAAMYEENNKLTKVIDNTCKMQEIFYKYSMVVYNSLHNNIKYINKMDEIMRDVRG